MSADWVTRQIMDDVGGPLSRKLARLRDAADRSAGPGTPAFQQYAQFYDAWQNGSDDDRRRLVAEAEAQERVAVQGAV